MSSKQSPFTEDNWVWVPFQVDKPYDGLRVDQFLSKRLIGYSRQRVQKILSESRATRNGLPIRSSTRVHSGEKIVIAYPRKEEKPIPEDLTIPVLYEDDDLIVINKPADLLSHPTDKVQKHTVLSYLRFLRPDITDFFLLHRLDRETSGVLALGKNKETARAWVRQMEKRSVQKHYIAFVWGKPSEQKGIIDFPIGREGGDIKVRQAIHVAGAAPCVTAYDVLETRPLPTAASQQSKCFSVVRAFPKTGRLHQIRVHLAAIGCPLLGDKLYIGKGEAFLAMVDGSRKNEEWQDVGFPRVALHAEQLTFVHPRLQKEIIVKAPWPSDMKSFLDGGVQL